MPTIIDRTAASIRHEMSRADLRQIDLAEALDLSQPAVSDRLRGRTPFRLHEVEIVAALLGVPLSTLIGDEDVTA